MNGPLVRAVDLTRRFGSHLAVDHVSLDLHPGEVVGLLGANGAGKTTVIRLLLGLLRPSAGSISLFGESPSRRTRRRLGYVPQSLGLYGDLTPLENLQFAHQAFGTGPVTLPDTLSSMGDVPVADLPLGVQRRIAFVQALAHEPDLLVLDEPTSGVDALAAARLWETMRDRADAGAGVLVTTHQMEEAEQCDRLLVMASGGVVAAGSVDEIVGAERVVVVAADDWTAALDAIETAGMFAAIVGTTLRVPATSLADVRAALAGVRAETRETAATLEERFVQISRTGSAATGAS